MNKSKMKFMLLSLYSVLSLYSLSGCAKNMDCNIDETHVHQYVDDKGLKKYIPGEKEYINKFNWTDVYTSDPLVLDNISKNNLCIVSENISYINNVISKYGPRRQAFVNDYVYGTYYGYGYRFDPVDGSYGYGYGLITGYHYEDVWKDISLDEYTKDKVRDITYNFKFYKIDENGNLVSKNFESLDEVEAGYDYFMEQDLVQEHVSNTYHLDKEDFKTKKFEMNQ